MASPLYLLNYSNKPKLPLILQTEMAECGLACLAMIAGYHGYKCDLVSLRSRHSIPLTGASLKSVMSIADGINLSTRPVKVDMEDLAGLKTPALLHWDLNHFVVLERVKKDTIVIHDPARGIQVLNAEEVSKHYTGIALECTPTKLFEKKDERSKMRLSDFWDRISGLRSSLAQILALSLILQLFALASPLYMQVVVDEAVLARDSNLLAILALGFLVLVIFEAITRAFRSYVVLVISNTLGIQMANNLFKHLIRLPMKYFENRHIGDTVSRFGSLQSVQKIITTGLVEAVVDGVMSIIMLFMLFLYSPMLAFIVLAVILIYFIVRLIYFKPFRDLNEESIAATAAEQSNFMETVRGIQAVKLFCNELERETLWQNRFAETTNANIRLGRYSIGFELVNGLLFAIENILIIYIAANLIMENAFTIGMLYSFAAYKQSFLRSSQNLIEKAFELKVVGLHLERIADIAKTTPESAPGEQITNLNRVQGKLELCDLSYRYSKEEPYIFDKINVAFEPGECIAIIGPSGCGKTTLMKVMLGLFPPSKGFVRVDGEQIERFGLRNYRNQIGAVMQDDKLFSGTIADNISFFDPQPDFESIKKCAKLACIYDGIMSMPMKFNSLVGDMGTTLSGGEKQRVLLARALYKKPKILFLDEASSHLDMANEQKVNENLRNMKITRIMIAHRESTIRLADRVMSMFNGDLIEVDQEELEEIAFQTIKADLF